MAVVSENMKWRRNRKQLSHPILEIDPTPQTLSIIQSTRCKSTLSSLLLSTFSNNNTTNETPHSNSHNRKKKNNNNNGNSNFSASTFRGFGCTAGSSQQVSVPSMIRSSADWKEGKKSKKGKKKNKQRRRNSEKNRVFHNGVVLVDGSSSATCVDFQDVWCNPRIGFSADAAASVDCVVARRNVSSRVKLDSVERVTHRERPVPPYLGRCAVNSGFSFLDDDLDIYAPRPDSEYFAAGRNYRHILHPSSDRLAEIMILQERLLMGGRLNSHDQFREWRLDVDNMSYEQLLELGERIGFVNTGLKEDEMEHNIWKIKHVISHDTSKLQTDKKCSICQEEYEADEEIGRLNCEHNYHFQCIKQWLVHKNFCPVCKQEVVIRH